MQDQNPYAAPQTPLQNIEAKLPNQITRPALSAEFIYAAEDARYCYYGYGLQALNMLILIGCRFIDNALMFFLFLVIPVMNLVTQVLCCIGLKKLSKMPQETNAGHWFRRAWLCWLSEIVLVLTTFLAGLFSFQMISSPLIQWMISILCAGLYIGKHLCSLLGLWNIQCVFQDKKLRLYLVITATTLFITGGARLVICCFPLDELMPLFIFLIFFYIPKSIMIFDYVILSGL